MGVYIKGMKKPSDCQYCVMYRDGYCGAKGGFCRSEKGVDADCPIVEVVEVSESEILTSSEKPNNSLDKDTNVRNKYDCDRYVVTNDEGERAYNCIGCERTDCAWKKGEESICSGCSRHYSDCYEPKTEPQIIACPIQEEDAEYAKWLYEPQTERSE